MELWQLVLGTCATALAAHWLQRRRLRRELAWSLSRVDDAVQVVCHVANHEAKTRNQAVSSLHLLYGLLQDEHVSEALGRSGAQCDALEQQVLARLSAAPVPSAEDGPTVLAGALGRAHGRDRTAGCADLWAALDGSTAAALLDESKVERPAVLFALIYPDGEPPLDLPGVHEVFVVLRNDDFSTFEVVEQVLREVFGHSADEAKALANQIHQKGRGIAARTDAATARDKVTRARALARSRSCPLWIGVEPT